MANPLADYLRQARGVIESPEQWSKGCFSRDAQGKAIECFDEKAKSFCALGACNRVYWDKNDDQACYPTHSLCEAACDALEDIVTELHSRPGERLLLEEYNDAVETTHADILNIFDKTIERVEATQ